MSTKSKRGCVFLALAFFLALQLVPVSWPDKVPGKEIPAPPRIQEILRQHCYDCHSSSTKLPWYGRVAPVSWLVSYDLRQGLSRLDFSNWEHESTESARYKIAHSAHRIRQGAARPGDAFMPPATYVWAHESAGLSESEREELMEWAGSHGMTLDGSHQRLRLHVPPAPSTDWPYLLAAPTLRLDQHSALEGTQLRSFKLKAPSVEEFDPGASARKPAGGKITGLNRYQGSYREATDLDQALLYVEGDLTAEVSGSGAVVVKGACTLRLPSEPTRLFVLASGPITLTGGGSECRLAVVSGQALSIEDLSAQGVFLSQKITLKQSSLTAAPELARGTVPLGPARRAVLTYCDRDGELTESDRRLEVLYDAGTFSLFDPEFEVVRSAAGSRQALAASEDLLALDSHLSLVEWERRGFREHWREAFESMPTDETLRAHLDYSLWEWIEQ